MPVKEMKISYYLKNPVICPLCGTVSKREDLLSGGGRFIAADLTDELRRIYEPSKKFGEIFPLNYPITVCPACFYATYHDDFILITPKHRPAALSQKVKRVREIKMIFPENLAVCVFSEHKRAFNKHLRCSITRIIDPSTADI